MGFYTSLKSERQGMPWRDSPLERQLEKPVNTIKLPLIMTLFPFGPAVLTSSDIPLEPIGLSSYRRGPEKKRESP